MTGIAEFYQLRSPMAFASPPECFSHSSLVRVGMCPLRYQLERAEFPVIGRYPARPVPAAIEGAIIHAGLERLLRSFSMAGLPSLGSPEARERAQSCDLMDFVSGRLQDERNRLEKHPRGNSFRFRLSPQELTNKIIRLFRQQYKGVDKTIGFPVAKQVGKSGGISAGLRSEECLDHAGVLLEARFRHPDLPFEGIIDLVYLTGGEVVIADYKSGAPKAEHRQQVMRYALLWWRATGRLPIAVEIRYFSAVHRDAVSEPDLLKEERALKTEIREVTADLSAREPEACQGDHCRTCDVRQFCNAYWQQPASRSVESDRFKDLEVTLIGRPSDFGFEGQTGSGDNVLFTYNGNVGRLHSSELRAGQLLRLMGVRTDSEDSTYAVVRSTEIWRMPG